jgi:hypothetical protein
MNGRVWRWERGRHDCMIMMYNTNGDIESCIINENTKCRHTKSLNMHFTNLTFMQNKCTKQNIDEFNKPAKFWTDTYAKQTSKVRILN